MRVSPPSSRPPARAAFTLPEILGVLALFGLVAGLVVANYDALPGALSRLSPEDAARRAFSAARRCALDTHAPATLAMAADQLVVTDAAGRRVAVFPAPAESSGRALHFIADDATRPADAPAVPAVRFSPDGVISPVRVRLTVKSATRPPRVWRADPLSGVLTEEPAAP